MRPHLTHSRSGWEMILAWERSSQHHYSVLNSMEAWMRKMIRFPGLPILLMSHTSYMATRP